MRQEKFKKNYPGEATKPGMMYNQVAFLTHGDPESSYLGKILRLF